MYQRGDIVSILFPFTDLSASKLRTALIISNNSLNGEGEIIVLMITSKEKADGFNLEITLNDIDQVLPLKSFVRYNKIATLNALLIQKKIGVATINFINNVYEKVNTLIKENELPRYSIMQGSE